MGLRETAASDAKTILEDTLGFAFDITVTDPDANTAALLGFSNDVSEIIDPETGTAVSARTASVALSIESLSDSGLGLPQGIEDGAKKPWIVEFSDINGNPFVFKVKKSNPDRAIGIVTCVLEIYKK